VPARPPTNLTLPADSFVGRDAEVLELAGRLRNGERLITLTGTGGVGKTRLARHVALSVAPELAGGVWFCDLTEARTLRGIGQVVGRVLGVPRDGAEEGEVALLGRVLHDRGPLLLVLDNFEQVVQHGTSTVGAWFRAAADARLLVTSRERLRLAGEMGTRTSACTRRTASRSTRQGRFGSRACSRERSTSATAPSRARAARRCSWCASRFERAGSAAPYSGPRSPTAPHPRSAAAAMDRALPQLGSAA